ncbi:ATP-binding protein [Paenibacillus sp. PL2-23]|uniref:ATP-binding protein n=1 Tax=Paenibacillus sp. PL2-23 TaxID=2100729 RepID=UPI0030F8DB7A
MDNDDQLPIDKNSNAHLSQLASVGQIAAGIAHEVKNPLTAVKGFLQLLKEKNEHRYIDIAENELNNALDVLQNLLQVSKPDLDEPFEPIDLTVELESIVQLFQDQFYRVAVTTILDHSGTFIYGKRNQLKRAFFNLLKNAFEAIPGKGSIVISHALQEDTIVIKVSDTGSGIPADKLKLLGTPFYTTKEHGTGMGLAFVYSVIYQNNGSIEVASEQGVGTTFTLTFARDRRRSVRESEQPLTAELQEQPELLEAKELATLREWFLQHRDTFQELLLAEAAAIRGSLADQLRSDSRLIEDAYQLALHVVDGREQELLQLAGQAGVTWSPESLTLASKLNWTQAVRRALWTSLNQFAKGKSAFHGKAFFFALEKRVNGLLDQFLSQLAMSFGQNHNEPLHAHHSLVEELSMPIIPLNPTTLMAAVVGPIDSSRSSAIEDRVLAAVGRSGAATLIIDLSGVTGLEAAAIRRFNDIIDGTKRMGCETIFTGIGPEIVKLFISEGIPFENKALIKRTVLQALDQHPAHASSSDPGRQSQEE